MPVTSVTESQDTDAAGQLENVYEITYTLANRPGSFTITVPRTPAAVEAAAQEIADLEAQVAALYAL